MGIDYSFQEKPEQEAHGLQAVMGDNDFLSKGELKETIKRHFADYACPQCGGHRIEGDKIVVEIGRLRFFREEKRKRLFGLLGDKYVETHEKDVWRVYRIYLESSGFLSSAGYLRCKSCKWEVKGSKGAQIAWYSIDDILKGRF